MAPILILWFGSGVISKIVLAAIFCFFPILVNTIKGLQSINEEALDLFKSFYASKFKIFISLRFPNSLPYIFSALKISIGLAICGAIVGEFSGSFEGIGYVILISSYHLDTVRMFAAMSLTLLIGMLLFYLISLIERKIVFWQG